MTILHNTIFAIMATIAGLTFGTLAGVLFLFLIV